MAVIRFKQASILRHACHPARAPPRREKLRLSSIQTNAASPDASSGERVVQGMARIMRASL